MFVAVPVGAALQGWQGRMKQPAGQNKGDASHRSRIVKQISMSFVNLLMPFLNKSTSNLSCKIS